MIVKTESMMAFLRMILVMLLMMSMVLMIVLMITEAVMVVMKREQRTTDELFFLDTCFKSPHSASCVDAGSGHHVRITLVPVKRGEI